MCSDATRFRQVYSTCQSYFTITVFTIPYPLLTVSAVVPIVASSVVSSELG